MTHNEKRTTWLKEGFAAMVTGLFYGFSNVLCGHPLDTIKTKMQVIPEYKNLSMLPSIRHLYMKEGFKGFYKGVFPPLCGGGIFRAVQFAVFEALYTKWEQNDSYFRIKIPFSFGLEVRVVFAGIASGTARSLIECPFEYSKVRRQTDQIWHFKNLYKGFFALWLRSTGLMTFYFILVDSFRRNTNAYKHDWGLFLMNGLCAMMGFALVWPFEIAKNYIQTHKNEENLTIRGILRKQVQENGLFKGLYRGSLPGLSSVYIRNGVSMIVMIHAQKVFSYFGYRDDV